MTDPDHGLADRARRGDRQALATLYERYRRRLFGFLVRTTGAQGQAEDLFQEVWMKAIRAIRQYDPEKGPFKPWLFRIATNAVIDRSRRDAVQRGPEVNGPGGDPRLAQS